MFRGTSTYKSRENPSIDHHLNDPVYPSYKLKKLRRFDKVLSAVMKCKSGYLLSKSNK